MTQQEIRRQYNTKYYQGKGIGRFRDNIEILKYAIVYLERTNG